MHRKKQSIDRVWYYLWLLAPTGGLGTYSLQIRGGYHRDHLKVPAQHRQAGPMSPGAIFSYNSNMAFRYRCFTNYLVETHRQCRFPVVWPQDYLVKCGSRHGSAKGSGSNILQFS